MSDIVVTVSGRTASGKSTIATSIQRHLKSLGFSNVKIQLSDNEVPPCPSDLNKRKAALIERGIEVTINETTTVRNNHG